MTIIGTGRIDLTKIKEGKEGESAKYVIVSSEQIFKFSDSKYLSTPFPETITINAQAFNINVTQANWEYYKNSREGWIIIESNTEVSPFIVDPFSDLWQDKTLLTIRLRVNELYYDEITIAKIADGTDGLTVIMTNETQTVPANYLGELIIPDVERIKTFIQVFQGESQLINTDTKKYFTTEIRESSGMSAKVTDYGNSITATSLVDDVGETEFTIRLVGEKLGGITKKFTLVKAKYGEDGKDGLPASTIDITGDQVIKQIGEKIVPQTLTLTATKRNFDEPVEGKWAYLDNDNLWVDIETGVSEAGGFSILSIDSAEVTTDLLSIKYYVSETIFDQTTIVKVNDGTGYTVILSNESMSVSSSADGEVKDLSGLSTFVYAYLNTKYLEFTKDSPGEGQYSMSVSYFEGGGAVVEETGLIRVIAFDKNYDSIQVPIGINLEGENNLIKYMTISKSKTGEADSDNNLLISDNIENVGLDSFDKSNYPFIGLVSATKPANDSSYISLTKLPLLENTYYTLSFSIKKTDGSLVSIGGDATQGYVNQILYTIDGVEYDNFSLPPMLEILNDGELHEVVYVFKTSTKFTRNEHIVLYINHRTSIATQFELHQLKLEKGITNSGWVPNLPELGGVIGDLSDTIVIIQQKTTDSAIVDTVTESTYFKDYMNSKVDLSALKDYATNENLSEAEKQWQEHLEAFYGDYLASTERFESELEQTSKDITAKFSASGGVNLIKNSVGFAGTQNWEMTPNTTISHIQNDELDNLGYGSGWYSAVGMNSSRAISQDFPILEGNDYTLTVYINKRTQAGVASIFFDDIQIGAVSEKTAGYEKFQYIMKKPSRSKSTIVVNISTDAEAIITGLIVHLGDVPLQWTMAPGEIYNTNVQMDLNGIKVANIQYGKEKNYTVMTPTKFAGYYDVNQDGTIDETDNSVDEVFRIDKDEFVMKNAVIRNELTMGPVKVIQISTEKNKGWAFLPNL